MLRLAMSRLAARNNKQTNDHKEHYLSSCIICRRAGARFLRLLTSYTFFFRSPLLAARHITLRIVSGRIIRKSDSGDATRASASSARRRHRFNRVPRQERSYHQRLQFAKVVFRVAQGWQATCIRRANQAYNSQ